MPNIVNSNKQRLQFITYVQLYLICVVCVKSKRCRHKIVILITSIRLKSQNLVREDEISLFFYSDFWCVMSWPANEEKPLIR